MSKPTPTEGEDNTSDPQTQITCTDQVPEDFEEAHPLKNGWTFWFNQKMSGARTHENYEKHIKKIGTFRSVEMFWAFYNHMLRPNDLPSSSDYHLFREGVKPMWEDDENKAGGKWIVRLKKGLASKFWEDLVLTLIGNQFDSKDCINGIVVSIRFHEDIISIWNKDADDAEAKIRIHHTCKKVLQLPPGVFMEYKYHDASMKDKSSYRNTDIFRSRNHDRNHDRDSGHERESQQGPMREGERDTRDRYDERFTNDRSSFGYRERDHWRQHMDYHERRSDRDIYSRGHREYSRGGQDRGGQERSGGQERGDHQRGWGSRRSQWDPPGGRGGGGGGGGGGGSGSGSGGGRDWEGEKQPYRGDNWGS